VVWIANIATTWPLSTRFALASGGRPPFAGALVASVRDAVVRQARNERVLLDFPANAGQRLSVRCGEQAVLRRAEGHVDDGVAHVELGVVLRVRQIRTDEEMLRQRVRLDLIDRGPLLGTPDRRVHDCADEPCEA
jgi:hypothetical protein